MGDSERVLRSAFDAANRHDLDAFFEHVADDVRFVNPVTGATNKEGMRGFHTAFFTAFPDINYRTDRAIMSGDETVLECTVTGTNTGSFMGMPPTNRPIEIQLAFVITTRDGKISEWHSYFDQVALQKQLAPVPETVSA
jgi:steroid delta-isomerase-like uncharacterized protein